MTVSNGNSSDPFAAARRKLVRRLENNLLKKAANALARNQHRAAEPILARFLEKNPDDPDALNLMADVTRRVGRFEEAEAFSARCVARAPQEAGYRFNFAVILRRRTKYEEALAQLDVLLACEPANPLFRNQRAMILRLMGRGAEALSDARDLVQQFPASAELWLNYGQCLRAAGLQKECIEAYYKASELAPESSTPYTNLADLKTYRFSAHDTEKIERILGRDDLSAETRADLNFALAKAYEDQKMYAKAFECYARANALRRMATAFDPEGLTAHRRNCEAVFTKRFFERRMGWGCRSAAPIFIVGLPRSGSTLLEQIISSHSAVEGLGERHDFDTAVGRRLARLDPGRLERDFWISGWFEFRPGVIEKFPAFVDSLTDDEGRALADDYLAMMARHRKEERPFFTDKGLRNFGYVGLIHLIFPKARIIDTRRHPLDWGWSCFKTHFPGGQPFAHRLADIGRHYSNYVRLMAHFDKVLPDRVHRVIYENLVAEPEPEVTRLLDFLELPFEQACLRFHESARAARTLSSEQVRMPLYTSGVGQWEPYEAKLDVLKTALGPILDSYPKVPEFESAITESFQSRS